MMQIEDLHFQLAGAVTGLADALRTARTTGGCIDCDRIICDQLLEIADEYYQKRATIEFSEGQQGHELKTRLSELTLGEKFS
jgi:hypothetical protein